ncbi:MAG: N-acetyltransferase family protein [Nitrospinales bacterium]
MRIREAVISDIEALASMASRTFIDTYDDLSQEEFERYVSEFFSIDRIREYLEEPGIRILVAEDGGLIGYIMLEKSKAPVPMSLSNQIECVRLFVDKVAQGQYIGSKLLEEARRISEQNGYDTLWLKVWDQNKKAISFYEMKGFRHFGTVPYTDGGMNDQVLIMACKTGSKKETGI